MVASSWSAGISLYGVLALLGIAGRLDWIQVEGLLQNPWCIGITLTLFVVELVVDKVAWLDSLWDAAHTVIRPVGGALIGAMAPDQEVPLPARVAVGALLALSSHSAKASARALINASPEPASNIVVSLVEDGLVAGLMALAIAFPAIAFALTAVLAVASTVAAVVLFTASRATWRRIARWRTERSGPAPPVA